MTRYKDQCIEVEQKFNEYLEDMTNDQAIAKINEEYGPSHAFACATQLQTWAYEDDVQCYNIAQDDIKKRAG